MRAAKQEEIESLIRKRILDRVYPPGHRFAIEPEFARELGIGRKTLRAALKKLETSNLISRIPRQGTFVNIPRSHSEIFHQLYFLIPCPDYMIRSNYATRRNIAMLLTGCLNASQKHKSLQIITLPMSETNRQSDINWSMLTALDSNSMVMIFGNWYEPLFPLLSRLKCRVAHIHARDYAGYKAEPYVKSWLTIQIKMEDYIAAAVRLLHEKGCRRVAILTCFLGQSLDRVKIGYLNGIRQCGQTPVIARDLPYLCGRNEYLNLLQEFYRQTDFDGLICEIDDGLKVDFKYSLNRNLGLPENIPVITDREYEFNRHLNPAVPYVDVNHVKCAETAVEILIGDLYGAMQIDFDEAAITTPDPNDNDYIQGNEVIV